MHNNKYIELCCEDDDEIGKGIKRMVKRFLKIIICLFAYTNYYFAPHNLMLFCPIRLFLCYVYANHISQQLPIE